LEVSTGAGRAELYLEDLNLTDLDIRGGVGEAIVTLPGHGRFTTEIHGGVGKVTVQVPAGLGVRIVATGGLGSVDVPSDYSREDHVYTSASYGTAESRVDIAVRGGIGQVTIQTI
jgi:predicted membrane protein